MASTSSVYGANEIVPFDETQKGKYFTSLAQQKQTMMAHGYHASLKLVC